MMKVLVTGATGFIGQILVKYLVQQEIKVHALYRYKEKTTCMDVEHVTLFKADINDIRSLEDAMQGCDQVFHLAAYTLVWSKNKQMYFDINFTGTKNVLDLALKLRVKKVVVTSTAGVFGPSEGNQLVDENTIRHIDYFNEYEKTKDLADKYIMETYVGKLPVCIVCPTRVFGPGELSESNSITKMIKMYLEGKWRYLPGSGKSIGNYVFADDVVKGMLMAMEKGKSGERYILGGENLSFIQLFKEVAKQSGKNLHLIRIPVWLLFLLSAIMILFAEITGIKPLITPGWTRKYLHNWKMSSAKAQKELNYKPVPFVTGLKHTIKSFQNNSIS